MIKEQLLSKNGTATMKLSKELLKYSIGDRIPTISEFVNKIHLARGTIQNALKNLVNSKAIVFESKGHMGSYIIKKNNAILLEFAGIYNIVGAMPLPYSKRYEGLASGIIISAENQNKAPINLAYMRGAKNRIMMVEKGRYDFAIVSRYAAEQYINDNNTMEIIIDFGDDTYTGKHVIMFHDNRIKEIQDKMRIGIDKDSYDQMFLTKSVCENKDVEYIQVDYSRTIELLKNGDIDATVMNIDEVIDKKQNINCVDIKNYNKKNTEAVIVINKDNEALKNILKEMIDEKTVLNIQKLVLNDKIIPRY